MTGLGHGVVVIGAQSVVLEDLWIDDAGGYGVAAVERAGVRLRNALVEKAHAIGVVVVASDAVVESTLVRATQADGAGAYGRGIIVQGTQESGERGRLLVTSSLVEENREIGVYVGGSDATVEATVVRATQPGSTGESGIGISVEANPMTGERGNLVVKSSLIDRNRQTGMFVWASDARVEATVVRATQPNSAGDGGWGVGVEPDPSTGMRGSLVLTSSLIEENHDLGVFVGGSDATVDTTVVRDTRSDETWVRGRGIQVENHAPTGSRGSLVVTASLIEENQDVGIMIFGSDARIETTAVRATRPNVKGTSGRGIGVQPASTTAERGRLALTSSLVEENLEVGVFVSGSDATVDTTVVRDTQPGKVRPFGRGISVQSHPMTNARGLLVQTSTLIEGSYDVGLFVSRSDATVEASVVRATKKAPAGQSYGDGILVTENNDQSSATLKETVSSDNERAGILYAGSTGELFGVRSSGNAFGLVLQGGQSGAKPVLHEGNSFDGNVTNDRVEDGAFAVPTEALPLP